MCRLVFGAFVAASRLIDAQGATCTTNVVDELPNTLHVVTGAIIEKPGDGLVRELAAGERLLFADLVFNGFDYALREGKSFKVVARTKETAEMTRCLKAYGGNGEYEGLRIGRVLKWLTLTVNGLAARQVEPATEPADLEHFTSVTASEPLQVGGSTSFYADVARAFGVRPN